MVIHNFHLVKENSNLLTNVQVSPKKSETSTTIFVFLPGKILRKISDEFYQGELIIIFFW